MLLLEFYLRSKGKYNPLTTGDVYKRDEHDISNTVTDISRLIDVPHIKLNLN